jgi:hypothetical protein
MAMGVGLLAGVGVFVDPVGSDTHIMASPPGGVWNGDRGRCDAGQRLAMGVGQSAGFGGVGSFFDGGGDDVYQADSQAMGVGDTQGVGLFVDAAGTDDYRGHPGRGNGMQAVTTPAGGAGIFRDL